MIIQKIIFLFVFQSILAFSANEKLCKKALSLGTNFRALKSANLYQHDLVPKKISDFFTSSMLTNITKRAANSYVQRYIKSYHPSRVVDVVSKNRIERDDVGVDLLNKIFKSFTKISLKASSISESLLKI